MFLVSEDRGEVQGLIWFLGYVEIVESVDFLKTRK
jgi:hypothetical protein